MRFSFSLPVRLALLVAGTMLPLIVFAGAIIYLHYLQDQREAFDRVGQVTRSIRLVLDREIQGIVSGLTVLANSRSLARDNFDKFRVSAEAFLRQFPDHPAIAIGDAEGRQIFHSGVPSGQPLPPRTPRPERDIVFKTGKPAFSPLFVGSVSKIPIVTVSVPVMRDGKVLYDLSFDPPLQIFQRIIDQQKPDDDWTISIFDQTGTNFARVPNPERTLGSRAAPSLLAVMFGKNEGLARTVSLEGVPLLTAFSRSELSGWTPAGGLAEKTLSAPAAATFLLAASVGGVMLLIGLGVAVRMATQIAHGEALHELLINELNHRVKNTLATVQSLAAQTFRGVPDTEPRHKFDARLVALGRAHDLLSEERWAGADLREVVDAVMTPFQTPSGRILAGGPPIRLSTRSTMMLSMVIHELATNAAKYGALSTSGGSVRIEWNELDVTSERRMRMVWQEQGGPPVEKPTRTGFGSTLIGQGVEHQLGGTATLRFERAGLVCVIECPVR